MNRTIDDRTPSVIVPILVAGLLSACSEGGTDPGGGGNAVSADMNAETFGHRSWNELSPPAENALVSTGVTDPFEEIVGNDAYVCTSENFDLTSSPKEFVSIQPDSSVLWLGNLIQGRSHLQVGSLRELSIRERAPLGISIDLLTGDNYRRVETPSLLSVNSAIGELIDGAIEAGHVASSDVFYESSEAYSTSQASLSLGFSAEYLGASAEASLDVDTRADEHTFYAYFVQKAFTVSVELPTSPSDVVTDDFTEARLQALRSSGDIGDDNPPLYVSNVSYGRVLIYKLTSTFEEDRIRAAIRASYEGLVKADGSVDTASRDVLQTAKIEIAAFGGDERDVAALIREGEIGSYFDGDTRLSSMRPISFEVRRLADNEKADIVRTTEYQVKSCVFDHKTVDPVGEVVRVLFDRVHVPADCDAGVNAGDIYGRFDVIYTDRATDGEVTRRVVTIGGTRNTLAVSSGNGFDLKIYQDRTGADPLFTRYYGGTFRLSGTLRDADEDGTGADDLVGNWNANQQDISDLMPGTHTRRATGNCSGSAYNPTLTFRLERESYIYE